MNLIRHKKDFSVHVKTKLPHYKFKFIRSEVINKKKRAIIVSYYKFYLVLFTIFSLRELKFLNKKLYNQHLEISSVIYFLKQKAEREKQLIK